MNLMFTSAEVKSKFFILNMDSLDDDLTISLLKSKNKPKESSEKHDWEAERNIFELQLTQLQEQLVASMVHNQNLEEEIKKLKSTSDLQRLSDDLEQETRKRRKAEEKVQRLVALNRSKSENNQNDNDDPSMEVPTDTKEIGEEVSRRQKFKHSMLEYKIILWNFIHERVSDFVNEEDFTTEEEVEEQLSVKRLKENLSRFSDAVQPLKKSYSFSNDLFTWKNPWLTIVVFFIFMYALWIEVAIPFLLMLILLQLSFNYLHIRGITQKFTVRKHSIKEETREDSSNSLSERYQLVLQIARTVQNTLGGLADAFEKLQNLFMWQHEEASKKLFQHLLFLFVLSIILPVNILIMVLGIAAGIKLFLVTPIYTRFPKVQRRYDDFQRLWDELPTHSQNIQKKLDEFERNEELKKDSAEASPSSSSSSKSPSKSEKYAEKCDEKNEEDSLESIVFSDRFQLPKNEAPLHDWQEGRRCTLMDKDSPLSSMKHGRLYLTSNYLCFERNQFHSKKNIAIKLSDFLTIKKAKPISFMPGPGMAIEIEVKGTSKPYMFAAMIGRDEAFDNILRAGKRLNLPWSKI